VHLKLAGNMGPATSLSANPRTHPAALPTPKIRTFTYPLCAFLANTKNTKKHDLSYLR
jgi:hypothetical protein